MCIACQLTKNKSNDPSDHANSKYQIQRVKSKVLVLTHSEQKLATVYLLFNFSTEEPFYFKNKLSLYAITPFFSLIACEQG